jgi:hypothetical protein
MRCHWRRMQDACCAIDASCTMHAVSLTPHTQEIFRTTLKSENHVQNRDGMQKKLKMHAVSLTPHARCMRCQCNGVPGTKNYYSVKKQYIKNGPYYKH